uniref:Chaperone protein DnaJ n=1 Tax=Noccaea caerulescens TaxID=107243 RepID=A0A1J3IS52_NOCCA
MASSSSDDLYAVLGLKKECTNTELRTAYKKLALRWHPDRCSSMGNLEFVEEAKKKFQTIQEAYSVLSDSNKRFMYDVGVYNRDDDDQNGMGDFLNEMATMMNQTKPSENNSGDSFEQLQDLFNEMFQGDAAAFASPSSFTASSCSFVFETDDKRSRSSFETSSMGINIDNPFRFDPRAHHTFSIGVEHQQDFKKGKNNGGGRRNRRKNNVQSQTSSSSNYGVPTS